MFNITILVLIYLLFVSWALYRDFRYRTIAYFLAFAHFIIVTFYVWAWANSSETIGLELAIPIIIDLPIIPIELLLNFILVGSTTVKNSIWIFNTFLCHSVLGTLLWFFVGHFLTRLVKGKDNKIPNKPFAWFMAISHLLIAGYLAFFSYAFFLSFVFKNDLPFRLITNLLKLIEHFS